MSLNRKCIVVSLVGVLGLLPAGLAAADAAGDRSPEAPTSEESLTTTFDTAASLQGWTFHNGPEFPGATGGIAWNAAEGHLRPGALALNYSFKGGGTYVQAVYALPKANQFRAARVVLKKPPMHRITFRVSDSAGQTFQKSVDYGSPRWQAVEVDLSTWAHSFGGPADGKVRFPLREFGIILENSGEPREGAILVDDIEFRPGKSSSAGLQRAGYDALNDGDWRAHGGQGNSYRDGAWTYTFNPGDGPGLRTGFSFLGRPVKLRLILDSDASGHGVSVTLGSHFQHFKRQIGKLTASGEQTLEAPLDYMSTWSHFGGEDDGQRRLPLRMLAIGLEKGDGPTSGNIRLKKLEIVTSFTPRESVVIIPAVSAGPNPRFTFTLRNLRAVAAKGRLACEFRTLGSRIARQDVELALPAGARPVTREFDQQLAGEFLEAAATWSEEAFTSKAVGIGTTTVPPAALNPGLQPENIIGCGLYLYRWNGARDAMANIARTAELAQKAGVKWSREEILWHVTESKEGQFNWAFYDGMIDTARRHGISIYGLLDYWADWADKNTEQGVEQYCRWARQVVRRYKDRIHHWEIWNEPNIFFWSGPRELYAKLLTKAYDAIKAEDPTAVVMGCSTAGIDHAFIKNVMQWGGKFDALTIHPYRGDLHDLGFIKELREVKELVAGRPVWITEIGFPSQLIDGWSERNQASLVARVYLTALASGACDNVSWYDFRNDGNDPFYNEYNFGIVRNDFRPKPAYRALATLGRTLGGMRFKEPVEIGADAYAFRFSGRGGDAVAACAPRKGRLLAFQSDANVTILNGMGEAIAPVRQGNLRVLTLDRGFPVYVSGPPGFTFTPAEPPMSISADSEDLRPGDKLKLRLAGTTRTVGWEMPLGWPQPKSLGGGEYELTVPAAAPSGHVTFQAVAEAGVLRLPVTINVQPPVIRI